MLSSTIKSLLALAMAATVSSMVTVPLHYASNITSTSNLVEAGRSRLAHFNGISRLQERSSSGAVSNFQGAYIAAVTIGGNTWNLIVDTGSSNTWCGYLTSCPYTETDCGYSSCEPTATGIFAGFNTTIVYGSAELYSAVEYLDVVSFGGLTIHNQSIGASWVAEGFPSFCDGIFGLGPVGLTKKTNTNGVTIPTFMDNLYSQGLISTEVLGVSFRPEAGADSNDLNGELTLGGIDSTKYTGSLTYFPKLSTGAAAPYWGVEVASMHYNKTSILSSKTQAIVDTGTTLIYVPTAAYNEFLSLSKGGTDDKWPIGSGLAFWMKRDNPTFANFTITLGTTTYTLTPDQYLVPAQQYYAYGLSSLAYYSFISDGGAIGAPVTTILGQKFLEQFYSVFDTTNARIGFAPV